jgi:hypothetical protein
VEELWKRRWWESWWDRARRERVAVWSSRGEWRAGDSMLRERSKINRRERQREKIKRRETQAEKSVTGSGQT